MTLCQIHVYFPRKVTIYHFFFNIFYKKKRAFNIRKRIFSEQTFEKKNR